MIILFFSIYPKNLFCIDMSLKPEDQFKLIAKNPFEVKSEEYLFELTSKHPHEIHEGDVYQKHHPKWVMLGL